MAELKKSVPEVKQYTTDIQKVFIDFLLSHEESFVRCQNIIRPEYFDSNFRPTIRYIMDYAQEYRALPLPEQLKANSGFDTNKVENIDTRHTEWFLKEFEGFCRHRAIENVMIKAPEKVDQGLYGDLEREIKEALLISLNSDLGTNYFADPKGRLLDMQTKNATVSTGWKTIDDKLYGGMNRGEMSIFAGNAGMGKSLFLQNLTLNWAEQGLDVIYITFELSENLVSMRLDAMFTGIQSREVFRKLDDVDLKVRMIGKKSGRIQVKYMPAGTTANALRAYLKEYEIQTGKKPDAICVDYLDLMHPNSGKVNASDMFIKDKYVSEELRALAAEFGILCATASQLNRGAVEEQEHDIAHIAGGLSKVNTADNVMTIFTSTAMRERGEYRIQFIKTRSSSGVGSKVYLKFDPISLRIRDMDDMENNIGSDKKDASTLAEELKAKRAAAARKEKDEPEEPETLAGKVQIKSAALRDSLRRVGGSD